MPNKPRRKNSKKRRRRRARPVLAIFTHVTFIHKLSHQERVEEAILNMQAAQAAGILAYYFGLDDVEPGAKRIYGWVLGSDGRWYRKRVPWPDVLYDRIYRCPPGKRRPLLKVRRKMRSTAKLINSTNILGKWNCHSRLRAYPDTAKYLPATVIYRDSSDLRTMLSRHKSVLVKPVSGSGGDSISLVWLMRRRRYGWQSSDTGKRRTSLRFSQVAKLVRKNSSRQESIVQQRIPLMQMEGRNCDIRIYMGKDESGRWVPVSSRMRVGQSGQFATNFHLGAEHFELYDALKQITGSVTKALWLKKQAHFVADIICRHIDKAFGTMGEVGVDLAYDRDLRLWMLEANAKPAKVLLPGERQEQVPKLYSCIMDYTWYLFRKKRKSQT